MFKKLNCQWNNVRVVMADKDIEERDVLKRCLPNASMLFHTLRSFRREVTRDNLW